MRISPLFLILFMISARLSFAQPDTYTPRSTYSIKDLSLVKTVSKLFDAEILPIRHKAPTEIIEMNNDRKKYLNDLLEEKAIIHDDDFQQLVAGILRRIETANGLPAKHRYIFIVKDPSVNAQCIGGGVFLINAGLLGRVESEDQLAFVLSHEIAHDELKHIHQKTLWMAETKFNKKQKSRIENMLEGKLTMKDVTDFRNANLAFSRINRQREIEADSLGFIYFTNTGYSEAKAIELLEILGTHDGPKYPMDIEMFLPLHTEEYPFDEHWLNPRLAVFDKRLENDFLYNLDSLSSHPDIPKRIAILESLMYNEVHAPKQGKNPLMETVIRLAEFETVESAFYKKRYDKCLLQALMLLQKYPHDSYLLSKIGGVLLQFYVAKSDNRTYLYLSSRTAGFSDELKAVNNFLHNISTRETGEILYRLLSNPENFDKQNKDHYFILWKLAELTYQYDMQTALAAQYKETFNQSIAAHNYKLHTLETLTVFDFWGWVVL